MPHKFSFFKGTQLTISSSLSAIFYIKIIAFPARCQSQTLNRDIAPLSMFRVRRSFYFSVSSTCCTKLNILLNVRVQLCDTVFFFLCCAACAALRRPRVAAQYAPGWSSPKKPYSSKGSMSRQSLKTTVLSH